MKAFRSIVLAAGIVAVAGVHNGSAQIETSLEFTTSLLGERHAVKRGGSATPQHVTARKTTGAK